MAARPCETRGRRIMHISLAVSSLLNVNKISGRVLEVGLVSIIYTRDNCLF